MSNTVDIHGHCKPRFSAVKEAFAKNSASLSWAYAMNKIVASLTGDPRSAALMTALYTAL